MGCTYLLFLVLAITLKNTVGSTIGERNHFRSNEDTKDTSTKLFLSASTSPALATTETCIDCPRLATCVPFVHCPAHVRDKAVVECHLKTGRTGVCCSTGQNHTTEPRKVREADFDVNSVHLAVKLGQKKFKQVQALEKSILRDALEGIVQEGTASYEHYRTYRVNPDMEYTKQTANMAFQVAFATKALKKREAIPTEEIQNGLSDLKSTPLHGACLPPLDCENPMSPYRTIDGSCNNLENPRWGLLGTSYSRLLPPSYADGIWSPRVSVSGVVLPSPRIISSKLFPEIDQPDHKYSLLLMQFGQFLSHDLTKIYVSVLQNGSGIHCCSYDGTKQIEQKYRHEYCMPIYVEESDPFFKDFGQGCINFARSFMSIRPDCTMGYSEQMNVQTHFLDGSMIYGADFNTNKKLRTFQGGRLATFNDYGRDLLPLTDNEKDCIMMGKGAACFTGGDSRINQFVLLTVLHTIFLREHNRIADQLAALNPEWGDEVLFQETRKIIIAELQHVTYTEFLPILLGEEAMDEFRLRVTQKGYGFGYDSKIDPSILNEFAAASFRLHTLVDRKIITYEGDDMEEMIEISDAMDCPAKMRKRKFVDNCLNTLTLQCMQKFDSSFAEGLTRYMFHSGNPFGTDVASLNIQRGRDHGLRPYNDYRELIGLDRFTNWNQYPEKVSEILSKLYESPEDVDLFVGSVLEPQFPGAIVGITIRDIIAEQFSRTRDGDRYFYEYGPEVNPGAFSEDQLNEIKKVTMARIICDNSDHILLTHQALNSFMIPSAANEYLECESPRIPKIDLTKWAEPFVSKV